MNDPGYVRWPLRHLVAPVGFVAARVVVARAAIGTAVVHAAHHEEHHEGAGDDEQWEYQVADRDAESGEDDHESSGGEKRLHQ